MGRSLRSIKSMALRATFHGSQGTFCFFSDSANGAAPEEGGLRVPLEKNGAGFRAAIPGPDHPLLRGAHKELSAPFTLRPDAASQTAQLEIDGRRFTLKQGEYSEWVEVAFRAGRHIRRERL